MQNHISWNLTLGEKQPAEFLYSGTWVPQDMKGCQEVKDGRMDVSLSHHGCLVPVLLHLICMVVRKRAHLYNKIVSESPSQVQVLRSCLVSDGVAKKNERT